jgi:hypothetical protein
VFGLPLALMLNSAVQNQQSLDPALQPALATLGQSINPIRVVDESTAQQIYRALNDPRSMDTWRKQVIGFRGPKGDPNIYLNRHSDQYQRALQKPDDALNNLKLAASLAHEQTHDIERTEQPARRIEADFLRSRLGQFKDRDRDELERYIRNVEFFANWRPKQ